ncbi:MAG: hypothetical protein IJC32_05205, partial [Clostridia bacterium]|nr:hypothetical protein [Clostridia bacterium]
VGPTPTNFVFLHQKRRCLAVVFVVLLFSDPNPFPQSSSKPMVFSHWFPEFGLGSPGPFSKGLGGGRF